MPVSFSLRHFKQRIHNHRERLRHVDFRYRSGFHYALHYLAVASGCFCRFCLMNNFLIHLLGWQGAFASMAGRWPGANGSGCCSGRLKGWVLLLACLQTLLFIALCSGRYIMCAGLIKPVFTLSFHEARSQPWCGFYSSAFWSVLLVGFVDAVISFLRIENAAGYCR